MKRWAAWIALGAVALGIGALLFAWSGLYNVSASSGHFAITRWFLNFTMRNSVKTHAMGIEVPALDDPVLVNRGAGHYATGCEPCHGGPGIERDRLLVEMVPPPPPLESHIPQWRVNELFWLVKHGLKYTAMPAWTAPTRDDEVWAMTAFLRRLPQMMPQDYHKLTRGPQASKPNANPRDAFPETAEVRGPQVLFECVRCHGRDGAGRRIGAFPRLDGQNEAYLYASLRAFAEGKRHSGFMQPVAERLEESELRALAQHYARSTAPADEASQADAEAVSLGASIAAQGVPQAGVPACATCHGPSNAPRHPVYPSLAGQHQRYLAQQLRLFKNDARGGTPFAAIMQPVAKRLSGRQIEAVAAYYASLTRPRPKARNVGASDLQ